MRVHDFAKRLGIPATKVRFYDRTGFTQSHRSSKNNYRSFEDDDALDFYTAQMFRSFGMSVPESLETSRASFEHLPQWLEQEEATIEKNIQLEEMRLRRIQEIKGVLESHKEMPMVSWQEVDHSFNYFTFNVSNDPREETLQAIQILAEAMPYSYIALEVELEGRKKGKTLPVAMGLGILERFQTTLGLPLTQGADYYPGGKKLSIFFETDDVLHLRPQELQPLLDAYEKEGLPQPQKLVGRIYTYYKKKGKSVYQIALAPCVPFVKNK